MDVHPHTRPYDPAALLRLKQVLKLVPVCPSTWWSGVKSGRFPRPVKLGPRITCWRAQDIFALIDDLPASSASVGKAIQGEVTYQ
ncbi:MAG: AlpA family phage regulatory protein [Deltaproteobacteria bacterium]|nr:AlpA family phage regulatory protein [Deltaproteobacteria bacterium]